MENISNLEQTSDTNLALLAGIWREVVGTQDISEESDFFQLGGDSLQMMTMLFRIQESTGIELSPGDVFNNPTLGQLASLLTGEQLRSSDAAAEGAF